MNQQSVETNEKLPYLPEHERKSLTKLLPEYKGVKPGYINRTHRRRYALEIEKRKNALRRQDFSPVCQTCHKPFFAPAISRCKCSVLKHIHWRLNG